MRSIWTAVHVFLATCLVASIILVWGTAPGHETRAAERIDQGAGGPLPASQIKLERMTPETGDPFARKSTVQPCFLLQFPEEMVEQGKVGIIRPDGPLHLEPEAPLFMRWTSRRSLAFVPAKPLRPASRYEILLSSELETCSGRKLEGRPKLGFTTPGLKWERLQLYQARLESVQLDLGFNLAVSPKDLGRYLSVRASGSQQALPISVLSSKTGKGMRIQWIPEQKQDLPKQLELAIAPGLRPEDGELGTRQTLTKRISLRGPLDLERIVHKDNGAYLNFDRFCELPKPGTWHFEPAIETQVLRGDWGLNFIGDFEPGRSYRIVLHSGFPGRGLSRIKDELRAPFLVPDKAATVGFDGRGTLMSSKAQLEFDIKSCNVDKVLLRIYRAYENNAPFLASHELISHPSYGCIDSRLFAPVQEHWLPLLSKKNESQTTTLSLRKYLKEDPRGVYFLELRKNKDSWYAYDRILLQISDLGVQVRSGSSTAFVRVHGIADGKARIGTRVRIYTRSNQLLAEARTAEDGCAKLQWDPSVSDHRPFLVEASDGRDRCFVDYLQSATSFPNEGLGGRPFVKPGEFEAWCQTDRGIIRPGETVHATLLIRDGRGKTPVGKKLLLRWKDSGGRVAESKELTVPADGMLSASLATENSSPTGPWQLELREKQSKRKIGGTRFSVEAFVPPRIAVQADLGKGLSFGQLAQAKISAEWMNGGAAAGLRYRAFLRFDRRETKIEQHKGYCFDGDPELPGPGAQEMLEGCLDDEGQAVLRFRVPDSAEHGSLIARLRVEVDQPSGRPVIAFAKCVAWRQALIGLRCYKPKAGGLHIDALHCRPDGSLIQSSKQLSLAIERRHWQSSYRRRQGHRPYWHTELKREVVGIHELELKGGRAQLQLKEVQLAPCHWLSVVSKSEGSEVIADLGEPQGNPRILQIRSLAKTPPSPGDTLRLSLDSPMAGTAWLSLEDLEPRAQRSYPVVVGRNEIELRIPREAQSPNLHAIISITGAQYAPGKNDANVAEGIGWSIGAISIPVQQLGHKAQLSLSAPKQVLPGSPLRVQIQAKGCSRACLAVVDEAVLRMTRHPLPDPLAWFASSRRLATNGCNSGLMLRRKLRYPREIATGGGGEDSLADFLSDPGGPSLIQNLAFFAQDLRIDATGKASAVFELPDFEGKLRIVAIAAGAQSIATGHAETLVRAPISLSYAGPRRMAPGDLAHSSLTLRNLAGSPGELHVELRGENGLQLLPAEKFPLTTRIEPEAQLRLELPIRASSDASVQKLSIHARLRTDDGRELEREFSHEFRVAAASYFDRESLGFAFQGEKRLQLGKGWITSGAKDSRPKAELTLGASFSLQLRPVLEELLHYPYGCLEQTTSRCRALLAVETLAPEIWPEEKRPQVRGLVRAGIRRIFSMSTYEGGFAAWPGGNASYVFGTLYAYEFLLEAKEAGYKLPSQAMLQLRNYLLKKLQRTKKLRTKLWTAALLLRDGQPLLQHLRSYADQAKNSSDAAVAAFALATAGLQAEAKGLLSKSLELPATRQLQGYLDSRVRTQALMLRAALRIDPKQDLVATLLQELLSYCRQPKTLTTQELAQITIAIAPLLRNRKDSGLAPKGHVIVGDERIPFDGACTLRFPWPESGEIRIESEGKVYGQLSSSGYRRPHQAQPKDAAKAQAQPLGLRFERVVRNLRTGKVAKRFVRGETYEVTLLGTASRSTPNLLVMDLLPAGFELENPRLGAAENSKGPGERVDRVERRDDRVLLFSTEAVRGSFARRYRMRAVFAGEFSQPGAVAEALYLPGQRWSEGSGAPVRIETH